MGITGLIPFLEKASRKTNVSEFSGGTVAVDTYCWLHKGAFGCADKIMMGQETDIYVKYCIKFVNMLLSHNIKPILVFDGRHLPAKAETEVKRRESRENNRKRAADLIKMGKSYEGRNLLRRSLDVSHNMALEVIKECQALNVDCIVAPYEADAQLAYLSISGIADVVITEDSDLTLFGCKKILFKMDMFGHGVLVEQERLHLAMGLKSVDFNMDKFRHMCILSGCDYLPSLPGIGLAKACKFIVKSTDNDIHSALVRLPSSLNKKSLIVTKEYRDSFMCALVTFKHQLVFCPLQRKQVRLNPVTPDVTSEQLYHAGTEVEPELAWQLALGNCDPFSFKQLHNFNPDKPRPKRTNSWNQNTISKHTSIWSKNFKIKEIKVKSPKKSTPKKEKQLPERTPSTRGHVAVMKTDALKNQLTPRKRSFEDTESSIEDILKIYKVANKEPSTKPSSKPEPEVSSDEASSPRILRRSHPFRKKTDDSVETSPNLIQRTRRRVIPVRNRIRNTVIDDEAVEESKFFVSKPVENEKKNEVKKEEFTESMDIAESMVVHVSQEDSKENLVYKVGIIPETEDFENKTQDDNVDSGFKESSTDSTLNTSEENRNDSVSEKVPLQTIDKNSPKGNDILLKKKVEDSVKERELKVEVQKMMMNNDSKIDSENAEDEVEFMITRQVLSESRSSLFSYETPEKKFRQDSTLKQSSQKNDSLSQDTSIKRTPKSGSRKIGKVQGQQSLLKMFGFQKKNSSKV